MNVDFPAPEGPTRKTNSPLPISTEQSRRAGTEPLYVLVTLSSRIIDSHGAAPSRATRAGHLRRGTIAPDMGHPANRERVPRRVRRPAAGRYASWARRQR